jgi:anaerobic magnesium-protoporphyrin IX monomethyl ester cyclase
MARTIPLAVSDVPPIGNGRNTARPVILIGFQVQANLGLGYLASLLRQYGYTVRVFDFEEDRHVILRSVRESDPLLVGFSLIFQFYVYEFRDLAAYLRQNGVSCHFTIGGHFPSLSYRDTLDLIPQVDSVVRFEGEMTLLELTDRLNRGIDWRDVQGIAFQGDEGPIATPPRHLLHDLDELPYPDRTAAQQTLMLGCSAVPLLASRGCARTCSFCSIHMFYRAAPGKVVRTRRPRAVVEEMVMLHEEQGHRIFLFQDDDFPLFGPVWQRWAREFIGELHRHNLPDRIIWKMNCRADVVEPEIFAAMQDAGLYLVYMGLESGSEDGLETLHKQVTVQQNLRAVEILKQLGLMFEFGFMLFDPSTTFESVRQNVQFLRQIVGDGANAAVFCRMIPYDGTPIKDTLAREGRLRGDVCNPDYDFLDQRVGDYYAALKRIVDVTGWIHGHRALSPSINFAWNEVAILERLFPALPDTEAYKKELRRITRQSNDLLFGIVEDLCDAYEAGSPHQWSATALQSECGEFLERLVLERNRFIARHQRVLMDVLERRGLVAAQA